MAWLVHQQHHSFPSFVLKQLVLIGRDVNAKNLLRNQRETAIMERLHPSPRIVNAYGSCGTSILVEPMVQDDVLSQVIPTPPPPRKKWFFTTFSSPPPPPPPPRSPLTVPQRLDLALTMARAVADTHAIGSFNTDLSLMQFLRNTDGLVKLNDFNSAFIPGWNNNHTGAGGYCQGHRYKWSSPVRTE